MKKSILFSICLWITSFTNAYCQTDFTGGWVSDNKTSDSFSLNITQLNNIITGYHCGTADNGNFIDCSFEDKSINGIVKGDSALITFISSYCDKPGTAIIKKINPNQIQWKIINKPDGPFYIPLDDMLDFSPDKPNVLNISNQDSSIIGPWQSEEDSDIVYVFNNNNKCYIYYLQELNNISDFTISNTTPQCGITVPTEKYTSYLQLQDVQDTLCYLINGITDNYLSLSIVDRGGVILYKRIHNIADLHLKNHK